MTALKTGNDRDVQRRKRVAQRHGNRHIGRRSAVLPCADDDTAAPVQYAAVTHVKHCAVNGVGIFSHVLQKENLFPAVKLIGRSCGVRDDRQVAAGE